MPDMEPVRPSPSSRTTLKGGRGDQILFVARDGNLDGNLNWYRGGERQAQRGFLEKSYRGQLCRSQYGGTSAKEWSERWRQVIRQNAFDRSRRRQSEGTGCCERDGHESALRAKYQAEGGLRQDVKNVRHGLRQDVRNTHGCRPSKKISPSIKKRRR